MLEEKEEKRPFSILSKVVLLIAFFIAAGILISVCYFILNDWIFFNKSRAYCSDGILAGLLFEIFLSIVSFCIFEMVGVFLLNKKSILGKVAIALGVISLLMIPLSIKVFYIC